MVNEDYVSFETAKLLKEKGFDVWGDGSYDSGIEIYKEYSPSGLLNSCTTSKPHPKGYPAPTLQMAMKWLREVHNIEIRVIYDNDKICWYGACNPMNEPSQILLGTGRKSKSYEEACAQAIKHCLENLI